MKKELSSIDVKYLVRELQLLLNGKIDKIFQPDKREFIFQTHSASQGKKLIRVVLPSVIYISEIKPESPKQPYGFCMFLRKYISNARIRKIEQHKSERIIKFFLEKKEGKFWLIFELFSKGNIILCSEDLLIMNPLENQIWKDREVRKGKEYIFPEREVDIFEIEQDTFSEIIQSSNKESIVKTIAVDIGLGGEYSEEMCLLAGVDKNSEKVSSEQKKSLFESFQKLLKKKIKANSFEGHIFPFELKIYEGKEKKFFDNFSDALNSVFSRKISEAKTNVVEKKFEKEKKKLMTIIEKQSKQVETMSKGIEENQEKGELIYSKYQEVKDVLDQITQAKKKMSYKEIKEKLKEKGIELNEKEKSVVVDIK